MTIKNVILTERSVLLSVISTVVNAVNEAEKSLKRKCGIDSSAALGMTEKSVARNDRKTA